MSGIISICNSVSSFIFQTCLNVFTNVFLGRPMAILVIKDIQWTKPSGIKDKQKRHPPSSW